METVVEVINPSEFGLEEKTAEELTTGLKQVLAERELLIAEFETVSKLDVAEETIPVFKALRSKIQKNRTQGINSWHKAGKEYFLRGGQFLDAIKRKENLVNEQMEEVLMNGEKHFENLEKERLDKLQADRVEALAFYVEDAGERTLWAMRDDEFDAFLATKKKEFEDNLAAVKQVELDRIEKEKADAAERELQRLENLRLKAEAEKREKAIEAERLEREKVDAARIAKEKAENDKRVAEENERLRLARVEEEKREAQMKAEREAREADAVKQEQLHQAALKKAAEEKEAIEAELKAKKEAEAKAMADAEAAKQAELSKGDEAKFQDLLTDLAALKTKYVFESDENIKMYSTVGILIDKVINHIQK